MRCAMTMAKRPPNTSLWAWLGRQVGYVGGAVLSKAGGPLKPSNSKDPQPQPATSDQPQPPQQPQVIYRDGRVEEVDHPTQPGVKLRRTIIDEVVVNDPPRE